MATRTGGQPFRDDGIWACTLIADSWGELEAELAEQAAHEAELAEPWN